MNNNLYMVEIESMNKISITKSRGATWEQVLELVKQNLKEIDTEERDKKPSPS